MRFATISILAAGAALLAGCGPAVSIHPLYTAQDLLTDLPLEGVWTAEDGEIWQIQKAGDGYDATVQHTGDSSAIQSFNVHVVRLKEAEFVDVTSKNTPDLAIPVHLFAKFSLQGDELRMATLNDDWVHKTLETGAALESVKGEAGGPAILSAATSDLQRFMLLHAGDTDAWDSDQSKLRRMR